MKRNWLTRWFVIPILMLWKRALSYRKNDWELSDYPVRVREQETDPSLPPRLRQHRYWARVEGWNVDGTGATRAEAWDELRNRFAERKALKLESGESLPRPGTKVPIKFASQDRIDRHADLAADFTHRVLRFEWAWISDGSSLWDFHADETNDVLCTRIKEVYGVDVTDIESANIAEILDRIAATRALS